MIDESFANLMIDSVEDFLSHSSVYEEAYYSKEQIEEVLYDFIRDDVADIRENYGYLRMEDLQDTMDYVLQHLEHHERILNTHEYIYQALDERGNPYMKQTNDFQEAKENFVWGTYGNDGRQPLRLVRLMDCSDEHLQAILDTQPQIGSFTTRVIKCILRERITKITLDEELFKL